jgi:hypothetical protein
LVLIVKAYIKYCLWHFYKHYKEYSCNISHTWQSNVICGCMYWHVSNTIYLIIQLILPMIIIIFSIIHLFVFYVFYK